MTLPTGKSFISYKRTRLSEVTELVASQKERGIPTWQDIEDLRTEPTEAEIRSVLDSDDIANVLLWVTPDVGQSPMITKLIPRWDVHFGGLEDDLKDSTARHITFTPQLGTTNRTV